MAARIGANFARRCMSKAAGNAKNPKEEQISDLVIYGYFGVTGAIGAYKGYNARFSRYGINAKFSRDGDLPKSTKLCRASAGALIGPIIVPFYVSGYTMFMGLKVFFPDK